MGRPNISRWPGRLEVRVALVDKRPYRADFAIARESSALGETPGTMP